MSNFAKNGIFKGKKINLNSSHFFLIQGIAGKVSELQDISKKTLYFCII